ncbi:hypothetical protein PTSG_09962 [Salpingoeca rosetta]|uniref:Uncharacterized protein n=1 Tax=Salpingoeca rosetta (strain ATCC 50818 / BSB-021) TaxID=946362 RepID=F2UNN5_SALR5|nr:uncharacterized protein PTSG_09962 [Salpingoeca rosetta]EGD79240.1 hypothetical protein PTSG_09962 [Salpingoeca rosetta]|eukprot:XP_004989325.1 hypothetical protein PTSG_09962 [Salpingoeca rosetta]
MGAHCCRASNAVAPITGNEHEAQQQQHFNKVKQGQVQRTGSPVAVAATAAWGAAAQSNQATDQGATRDTAAAAPVSSATVAHAEAEAAAAKPYASVSDREDVRTPGGADDSAAPAEHMAEPSSSDVLPGQVVTETDDRPTASAVEDDGTRDLENPSRSSLAAAATAAVAVHRTVLDMDETSWSTDRPDLLIEPVSPVADRTGREGVEAAAGTQLTVVQGPTSTVRTTPRIRKLQERLHFVRSPFEGNRHPVSPKIRQVQLEIGFIKPAPLRDPFQSMWPSARSTATESSSNLILDSDPIQTQQPSYPTDTDSTI